MGFNSMFKGLTTHFSCRDYNGFSQDMAVAVDDEAILDIQNM
jgi:hypothetical protein